MNARFGFRILFSIVLIAVLAGIGVLIYNAGVSQGLAAGSSLSAPEGQVAPFVRPWGFGFFPLGCILPLFFGLFIVWVFSAWIFRGRRGFGWGPRHWRHWGESDRGPRDVPPMVEEWHRKMHEGEGELPEE